MERIRFDELLSFFLCLNASFLSFFSCDLRRRNDSSLVAVNGVPSNRHENTPKSQLFDDHTLSEAAVCDEKNKGVKDDTANVPLDKQNRPRAATGSSKVCQHLVSYSDFLLKFIFLAPWPYIH